MDSCAPSSILHTEAYDTRLVSPMRHTHKKKDLRYYTMQTCVFSPSQVVFGLLTAARSDATDSRTLPP